MIVVKRRRKKIWTTNRRVLDWWFVKLGAGKMSMENQKVGLGGVDWASRHRRFGLAG